jgi:hypothetical protein
VVTATTVAERAIEGLRTTVTDCDATLGERLRNAERISADLSRDVRRGDEIISRIHRIAVAAKAPGAASLEVVPAPAPVAAAERPATSRLSVAVAAAQAIASRTRGQAA